MEKILIIDDEAFIRENVVRILDEEGYEVQQAGTASEARKQVSSNEIDLVLLDLNLGNENGITVLKELKEIDPELLVIIITGYGSVETAVDSLKLGAFHYMKKPFKADALRVIVKLALQTQILKREVRRLKRADSCLPGRSPLIGKSPAFCEIIQQIRDIASIPSTVLITGESGTGKELVARGIHDLSQRSQASFVAINCASIPATLLESELFGHEKGSFTNATSRKPGLFEEAQQGTVFLDEIGEMDIAMQSKLLRVLEERTIRRVGGVKDIQIDVRIIAATNRNLQQRIAEKTFREDLYYRLNVIPIHLPPLRERKDDIEPLTNYFLDTMSRNFGKNFSFITPDALEYLIHYPWPGNIRELRNIIERICIMKNGPNLITEYLPQEIREAGVSPATSNVPINQILPNGQGLEEAVIEFETNIICNALKQNGGNVLQTAESLKIARGTLRYKIDKYGLASMDCN